ncbi:MAG: dihydrodipicolinate synthase family protein [Pseudorhodobacter sp.]
MVDALTGIFPVLPTPFRPDGTADMDALVRLVVFAEKAGVAGVVYPGFASEVETLARDERAALLKAVAGTVGNRLAIVAGASAPSTEEVIEHGRSAAALGIHHLMIQPPKSLGQDARPVAEFLSQVAAALPQACIILQNAPAPRGSDLSPATIVEIVKAVPQVAYVKEETLPAGPAITHILAHRPAHLLGVIGGGGARYILDEYARGACAAMPALELAPEHVAMDRAWREGCIGEARALYIRTLPLLSLQAVYRMRLTKYVLMRRGVLDNAEVRAPTPELDAGALADIDINLAELGIGVRA